MRLTRIDVGLRPGLEDDVLSELVRQYARWTYRWFNSELDLVRRHATPVLGRGQP